MPFCPNPDCPHRKRIGEPAEFSRDVHACSDCGSSLSDTPPVMPPVERPTKAVTSDFRKRLLLTLLLLLFWHILRHIGAPGIDYGALSKMSGDSGRMFFRISLFSLGLVPYITAYILVEICALFLPPLKSWRTSGYPGRAQLAQTARWVTLALALVHGYFLAQGLENMSSVQAVYQPGWGFRLMLMVTLTAGAFLMLWIADMISTRGIGHGISLLIFSSYVSALPHDIANIIGTYEGFNPLKHFLGTTVIIFVLIAVIVLVERAYQKIRVKFDDGREAYMPMKLTTAGIVPSSWVPAIMLLPATIAGFIGHDSIWRHLSVAVSPGEPGYYIGSIFFMVLFYYVFTLFFHRPKAFVQFLKDKNAEIADPSLGDAVKSIRNKRNAMACAGALYLCFFALLPDISSHFLETPLEGVSFIVTAVIALDLIAEIRIRRYSGKLIRVAEFQKPAEAGLLKSILKQYNIPCQLRGYHHRSLLYFFGPYIEISAFVPEDRAAEANDVIAKYLKLS